MENKVIILDWGFFIHTAGWAYVKHPDMYAGYTCLNMIVSNLKKVGVNPNDEIIVAVDFLSSWRKDYEKKYKEGRKKLPREIYEEFNKLADKLEVATDWHFIKIPHFEADDIMAVGCRYYKDKEVVLVTADSDLEQCWLYPNVKIFSPHAKSHRYKIPSKNFNPYKLVSNKIEKEVADNLKDPIRSPEDYEKRRMCVDLLNLPEEIESEVEKALSNLQVKELNIDLLPFKNIRERYMDIYKSDKIVTYEASIKKSIKKKKKKQGLMRYRLKK